MDFPNGSRVEIRAAVTLPWRPGEVVDQDAFCWHVTLDTPVTADDWAGVSRRYGPTDTLTSVAVFKATEDLLPGTQIRPEGGP